MMKQIAFFPPLFLVFEIAGLTRIKPRCLVYSYPKELFVWL